MVKTTCLLCRGAGQVSASLAAAYRLLLPADGYLGHPHAETVRRLRRTVSDD